MPSRQAPDAAPPPARGREAQRRRTRWAIVAATQHLVELGNRAPTVDAVAEAAEVSRRTVYMHFPTLDQLLLDATLGALSSAYVDSALADGAPQSAGSADARTRVDALAQAVLDTAPATLPLGRQLLKLTVDPGDGSPVARGRRRQDWIETAIAPLAVGLDDEQRERLTAALSLVIGFESMVVLRDVCGLDADREARVVRWAAVALVDAMRAELDSSAVRQGAPAAGSQTDPP